MVSITASYLKVPGSVFGSDPRAQVNLAVALLRNFKQILENALQQATTTSISIQIHNSQTVLSSALEDCKFCRRKFVLN